MKTLSLNTMSPDRLPVESEEIIQQIIDPEIIASNKSNCNVSGNTVFSSGFGSRKSSVASLNSHQSFSSGPSTTAVISIILDSYISLLFYCLSFDYNWLHVALS